MCGRFTFRQRLADMERSFNLSAQTEWQLPIRYNICPTTQIPVIRQTENGRELSQMQWGFVPSWAKDANLYPINARSEEVSGKPFFRNAIRKHRCLIPADGFYEWKRIPKKIKGDAPWFFEVRGGEPFAFAGIWEENEKFGTVTCAMLTTSPNELMAPIHDRLPVILSPNDYDAWLDSAMHDPAKLAYLYEPFPSSEMSMKRGERLRE